MGSSGKQTVSTLGGFIPATGSVPVKKAEIDYFTPINQPITEYAVVQELLNCSEAATAAAEQQYVINTFNLGVCMKALPLIWKFPEKYRRHIVIPGEFQTAMNYLVMMTAHKCHGSGYAEIPLEAQLVTSGCLKSVLSGKAYAKALFCLKTGCEAMGRLFLKQFIEEENIHFNDSLLILNLLDPYSHENLNTGLNYLSALSLTEKYQQFEDKMHKVHLGKAAVFWVSFIYHHGLFSPLH